MGRGFPHLYNKAGRPARRRTSPHAATTSKMRMTREPAGQLAKRQFCTPISNAAIYPSKEHIERGLTPPALFHDTGLVAVPVTVAAGGAFVKILLALTDANKKLGLAVIIEE